MDSYNKIQRRKEIEKLLNKVNQLSNNAIEFLATSDLKSADDCHIRIKHLLEQSKCGIDELKRDLNK